VDVLLTAEPPDDGDARMNLDLLRRLVEQAPDTPLRFVETIADNVDLIVDALLGTGLSSDVRSPMDDVIRSMNDAGVPVLAVDIPSGLDADTGAVLGIAVRADVTVTMGALKAGLLLDAGPDLTGDVVVADIGIPDFVLESLAAEPGCARLSSDAFVAAHLHPRTRADHKYTSGPTIVAGGSEGFVGAPVLSATGAARVGSGYVNVYAPPAVTELLQRKLAEIPVTAWSGDGPETDLDTRWTKAKALLVGPGMGRSEEVTQRVRMLLDAFPGPAVVDADGLFALADARKWVHKRAGGRWVFTPHEGERARMTTTNAPEESRIQTARRFARDWNVVLLLKGQPSITAAPDGRVVVNATGHPAAGTAGSGDVLAGMVAGLLAQGLEPFDAAVCAIHLGGLAVEDAVATGASRSLMASDILTALPRILSRLTSE